MSKFTKSNDDLEDAEWEERRGKEAENSKAEPIDNRSLFEKLQEQKAAKEDAYNEAAKFSNLIRRLDNDEIDFLVSVSEQKEKAESAKQRDVEVAISKFRMAQRKIDLLQSQTQLVDQQLRSTTAPTTDRLTSSNTGPDTRKRKKLGVCGVIKKKVKDSKQYDGDGSSTKMPDQRDLPRSAEVVLLKPEQSTNSAGKPTKRKNLISYDSSSDVEAI